MFNWFVIIKGALESIDPIPEKKNFPDFSGKLKLLQSL